MLEFNNAARDCLQNFGEAVVLNNIIQWTDSLNPFDHCVSQLISRRLIYCLVLVRLVWCKPGIWPEVEASINTHWAFRWYSELKDLLLMNYKITGFNIKGQSSFEIHVHYVFGWNHDYCVITRWNFQYTIKKCYFLGLHFSQCFKNHGNLDVMSLIQFNQGQAFQYRA